MYAYLFLELLAVLTIFVVTGTRV